MRFPLLAFTFLAGASLTAQCPYYNDGTTSAGLARAQGGTDARLVYVDCLASIGLVRAKFGTPTGASSLNGLPLTIAILDDPTNDLNPADAVLVAQVSIPGGVTGGNSGQWQTYDLNALLGAPVPTTGGMWVAVGVTYPAGLSPGPGSIEFFNNSAPGTQWLATDSGGVGINYASIGSSSLVDIQTGPGFPPGSWVIEVESGAEYRAFGAGCAGSNGVPTLAGGPLLPIPGQFITMDASNLPNPSIYNLTLLALDKLSVGIDIGSIFGPGPVGCSVLMVPLVVDTLATTAGTGSVVIPVPAGPSLVGVSIFGQIAALDPGANAAGWTTSNGLRAVIGY